MHAKSKLKLKASLENYILYLDRDAC